MLSTYLRGLALASIASSAAAQNPLIESYGSLPREGLGLSVGLFQDVDGDGVAEYAVRHARGVRICRGTDGATLREIQRAQGLFGDVDGDGVLDLFAETRDEFTGAIDAVEVLSGASGASVALWPWSGAATGTAWRDAPQQLGDVDFDGRDDLIFRQSRFVGGFPTTEVAIASGLDASILRTHLEGYSFAVLGDLDGDGAPDYYVGPDTNNASTANVFSGASGATLAVHAGAASGSVSAQGVSDVDGDGLADLALSKYDPQTFASFTDIVASSTGAVLRSFPELLPISLGGAPLHGDFDGNGADDLLLTDVAARRFVARSLATGAVAATFEVFSTSASAASDRDGDGIDEVLLGLPATSNARGKWLLVEGSYSELVGVPFAFGDGSSGPCPCANGAPGEGCANSLGVGAALRAWGSTSIAQRELLFHVRGAWVSPFSLLGRNFLLAGVAAPAPTPFTGGLLAIAAPIQRVAHAKTAGWDVPSLGAWSTWSPGQVVSFQVWYREGAPSAACGFTGNFSNALAITFAP